MPSEIEPRSETFASSPWITDLQQIEKLCLQQSSAHQDFKDFLKTQDEKTVDSLVQKLSQTVAANIDCTKCANCCKSLTVSVSYPDRAAIAEGLQLSDSEFISMYMKKNLKMELVFAQRPCPLLKNNLCSVYKNRPQTCRTYPHLDKDQFISRLGNVISNLKVCPIAFNTFELLKLNYE